MPRIEEIEEEVKEWGKFSELLQKVEKLIKNGTSREDAYNLVYYQLKDEIHGRRH
jgi:putative heme iron utilization protein